MFVTAITLKCALLVSQWSYGRRLEVIQFYLNNTITQRIISCCTHKMAIVSWPQTLWPHFTLCTLCPKKVSPRKHFATATANLHRFKWNFTHTRRHLFLSSTSNFIRISYSVYETFNSFKLLSQISVTDTTYFLLTSSVVTGVTSVRVDKQTTCYQKRIEL